MATTQGTKLVQKVIKKLQTKGFDVLDEDREPRPIPRDLLASLRLPGDKPLSPSLVEWLAFDAGFLGWFADGETPTFPTMNVGELALSVYDPAVDPLAHTFRGLAQGALPGLCLPLPLGADSRRFLYLSEPDGIGEYPVLLIDIDDQPFVCVEYPGLDVYLATHAGLIKPPEKVYGAYADDPRFAERMQHHIEAALGGRREIELEDDGFPLLEGPDEGALAPPPRAILGPDDEVPEGYVVDRVGMNPFTQQPMRFLKRKGT